MVGGLDDHLGSFAIAVPLMRKGYRNITLQNYGGRRLTPASLFVHLAVLERPSGGAHSRL
jgi:hypothetical protein